MMLYLQVMPTVSVFLFFVFLFLAFVVFSLSLANQPHSKVCMHAYLFPFPISHQTHNATEYDSAISKCHTKMTMCRFPLHLIAQLANIPVV